MNEKKSKVVIVFFDEPNIWRIEKEFNKKLDHYKFFKSLPIYDEDYEDRDEYVEKYKNIELHIYFYWQPGENSSSYRKHLEKLRRRLNSQNIMFTPIETTEKDVDITMINDMIVCLFNIFIKPEEIILCSGDGDFSIILGVAKKYFNVSVTVISREEHCSESLKDLGKTIFIEKFLKENEDLFLNFSNE